MGLDVAEIRGISFSSVRTNAVAIFQATFAELFVRIRWIVVGIGFYFVFLLSYFFHVVLLSLR